MGDVDLAASAKRDLEEIEDWMAQHNPAPAVSFIESLAHTLDGLANMPLMGRARPEIRPGLRSIVHGSHIVFYRPTRAGITVLRVIHGARDIASMTI